MIKNYIYKAIFCAISVVVVFCIAGRFVSNSGIDDMIYIMLIIVIALLVFLVIISVGIYKRIDVLYYGEAEQKSTEKDNLKHQ